VNEAISIALSRRLDELIKKHDIPKLKKRSTTTSIISYTFCEHVHKHIHNQDDADHIARNAAIICKSVRPLPFVASDEESCSLLRCYAVNTFALQVAVFEIIHESLPWFQTKLSEHGIFLDAPMMHDYPTSCIFFFNCGKVIYKR
jgi:hypothetical protein